MATTVYLAVQSTYQTTDIALFENRTCLERRFYSDSRASSHLVPHFDTLLKEHKKTLTDLAFIAVDKGPGAFTTLRVTIATLNGIAFAHKIPLIGIDGLEALAHETLNSLVFDEQKRTQLLVILLNAYSSDVYFHITSTNKTDESTLKYGYKKIDELLQEIATDHPMKKILFTGNGAFLHQKLITEKFGTQAIIQEPLSLTASSITVGALGFTDFKAHQNIAAKIVPNYLKTQLFAIKKTV